MSVTRTIECERCARTMPAIPILWGMPEFGSVATRGAVIAGCCVAMPAPEVACVRCQWFAGEELG